MASWLERAVEAYGGAEAAEKKARELGVSDSQINAFKNAYNNSSNTSSASDDDSYSAPKQKQTVKQSTPKATTYADTRGTEASPTINYANPYGGNVTKYSDMSDDELMALYHGGINGNNWNGYDLDPLRYELLNRDFYDAAMNVNDYRNTKNKKQDLGYAEEFYNERTGRFEPRTDTPPTMKSGSAGYSPDDAYDWLHGRAHKSRDERTQTIEDYYQNETDATKEYYDYIINKGIQELNNALENSKTRYNEAQAQSAIQSAQAADNLALRNAAAGDLGGIGGKLYSDQQAAYDAQVGQIRNEQLQFYNQTQQQAALLEAQGRFEEASALRQVAAQKLEAMLNLQSDLWNAGREDYKWVLNYGMNHQQQALQNAFSRMQMGLLNESDIMALGVPAEEAKAVADRYNLLGQLNVEEAKLGLQEMAQALAINDAKMAGTYGTGAGSTRQSGGNGLGGSLMDASESPVAGETPSTNPTTPKQTDTSVASGASAGEAIASEENAADELTAPAGPMSFNDIPGLVNAHTADSITVYDQYNKPTTLNPQQLAAGLADGTIYKTTGPTGGVLYRARQAGTGGFNSLKDIMNAYVNGFITPEDYEKYGAAFGLNPSQSETGGFTTVQDLKDARDLGLISQSLYRKYFYALQALEKQNAAPDSVVYPDFQSPTGGYYTQQSLEDAYLAGVMTLNQYLKWRAELNKLSGNEAIYMGEVAQFHE